MYHLSKIRKDQHAILLKYDQHMIPEIQLAIKGNHKAKGKAGKLAGKGAAKPPVKSIFYFLYFLIFLFEFELRAVIFIYLLLDD